MTIVHCCRRLSLTLALCLTASIWLPTQAMAQGEDESGRSLSSRAKQTLLTCSLTQRHSSWYFSTKRSVIVKQNAIGIYRAGWRSMMYAFKIPACVAKQTGVGAYKIRGLKALSHLSGIPVYAPRQQTQRNSYKVNYYNPALIQWVTRNIPSPSAQVAGVSMQKIYNTVFRRFVRISAYTYLYLQQKGRFSRYLKEYRRTHLGGTPRNRYTAGRNFRFKLRGQLQRLVMDPILINNRGGFVRYYYNAGTASLFWMRRGIDQTHKEVWLLLRRTMRRYDRKFYSRITRMGSLKPIRLRLPQLPPAQVYRLTPQTAQQLPKILQTASPNSKIQLAPGIYRFNKGLVMASKHHLVFEGIGNGAAWIIIKSTYDNVLSIMNSRDITIRNIRMRHEQPPAGQSCRGAVVNLRRAQRIWIDKTELNGSGAIGVMAWGSNNVVVTRSHIHKNSYAAFQFSSSRYVHIEKNLIENNGTTLYCAYNCGIRMRNNTIRNNKGDKSVSRFVRELQSKMRR